jgi:hypothetical protein
MFGEYVTVANLWVETADSYAQIGAFVVTLIMFFVAIRTLRSTSDQVAELVRAQRSDRGPILSLSFTWGPSGPLVINISPDDSLASRFLPYRANSFRPYRDKTSVWALGEFDKTCEPHVIKCQVKNIETHPRAYARNIFIEIIGVWVLFRDDSDGISKGFVHLYAGPLSLAPGEAKELEVVDVWKFGTFQFLIRHLQYHDLWGHKGHAYLGHQGGDYWPPVPIGKFRPIADIKPDYPTGLAWSPYQEPIRLHLLRERFSIWGSRMHDRFGRPLGKLLLPLRRFRRKR